MSFEIADITPRTGSRKRASSLSELAPEHLALLDRPLYATVATLRGDGPPHLTTVWVDRDDGHVRLNSAKGRIKDRHLRARPECSLMLVDPDDPYHWLSIEGEVVEIVDEEDPARGKEVTEHIDSLSEAYVGKRPYATRNPAGEVRVMYRIAPTRIVTFGPVGR